MMQIVKLNPERKALLVAALRSGEYQQGRGRLYDGIEGGYCCYGVACVLAEAPKQLRNSGRFYFGDHSTSDGRLCRWDNLPRSISEWLGIPPESYKDGRIYIPVHDSDPEDLRRCARIAGEYGYGLVVALDSLNDALDDDDKPRFPFERIAALIEERL